MSCVMRACGDLPRKRFFILIKHFAIRICLPFSVFSKETIKKGDYSIEAWQHFTGAVIKNSNFILTVVTYCWWFNFEMIPTNPMEWESGR